MNRLVSERRADDRLHRAKRNFGANPAERTCWRSQVAAGGLSSVACTRLWHRTRSMRGASADGRAVSSPLHTNSLIKI